MRLVSIIIPTFRRLDVLPDALASHFAQKVTTADFEIVVVDNSPEGSAMEYLRGIVAKSPVPMTVVHESRPGIAFARNAALAAAKGELIAFLDDDTQCGPTWLQCLLDVRDEFDAAMVFAPNIAQAPSAPPAHRAFIENLFTRPGPDHDRIIHRFYGASSSLHVRSLILAEDPPFPLSTNDTGGEDDFVFSSALAKGRKVAWASKALAWETILPTRANLKYAYRRSFAFGQGACRANFYSDHRSYPLIAWHMAMGCGQMAVFGTLGGLAWLLRLPNRAAIFNQAVRGAGKVIWKRPTHLYGAWLEKETAKQARASKKPDAPAIDAPAPDATPAAKKSPARVN